MNKFTKKIITILIVFILIYIGLFFLIARPRFSVFLQRYKDLSETQNKLADLSAKQESLARLQKDESRINGALTKAKGILPEKKETSDFLAQIEAASRQTGNNLKSITVDENPKAKAPATQEDTTTQQSQETQQPAETQALPYKRETFTINMGGDFIQLLNFIALSESLSRFTTIQTLNITTGENNILTTKIEGEIYYNER